ncbi:MAG TPA: hypothetical protein PKL73_18675 [Polyangiaceae bacterium]|jgi:hypothetical protein|nr:MAG: hypothetical protein BWY17_04871 [Deltaproteobacteria bacterium ADurb.Bin207]HNS98988.1 hypothetical protein [Polyangiaceae bacterium]HNZ25255.1 hypothetical protein [Polyangiaceae bacterium]HOD24830.1 hypothetical protein [Polyangiaceae bacterium]HOE51783.1 hypothetical protein [Polyangiaceae bacterium]
MGLLDCYARAFGLWLLLTTALGCCGPNYEQVLEKHRAAVEKKIAPLPSIHKQLLSLPALQKDEVNLVGAAVDINLSGSNTLSGNTLLCHAEDFAVADELGYVPIRLPTTGKLNQCSSILHRNHDVFDPAKPSAPLLRPFGFSAQSDFERCEAAQNLLILRILEVVEPSVPVAAASSFQPNPTICDPAASVAPASSTAMKHIRPMTFSGGRISAEALFFSLDDARYLGGFRVQASSSSNLKGTDVQLDFSTQLRKALAEGVRKHIPGATVRE